VKAIVKVFYTTWRAPACESKLGKGIRRDYAVIPPVVLKPRAALQ
jgi:hypothetical protein